MPTAPPMTELSGIPVSGGSGVGRAVLFEESPGVAATSAVPPRDVETEIERLHRAAEVAKEDLASLTRSLGDQGAVSQIFAAHAAMLDDFMPRLEVVIREGTGAEHAVATVLHAAAAQVARVKSRILAQRAQDIVDVERRMLRALGGLAPRARGRHRDGEGPVVVVARDLTPSEAAELQTRYVAGVALEQGGHTSHTALVVKSLQIPCVVGVRGLTRQVQPGQMVWVDGSAGLVVIEPDAAAMERAVELGRRYEQLEASLLQESDLPAETLDGHRAVLLSNIEFPLDVDAGVARGAAGVGLYRTEFLYEGMARLPTEQEHVDAYRTTLERLGGGRLTVRTFDFGADKESPLAPDEPEPNPALGVRSLRWCFEHLDAFATQLRALLRVAAEGDVRIMLPMVGGVEELRRAKAYIAQAAAQLEREGIEHRPDPPIGIMIEIPGAAVTADILAREVDFFSIGTNDLIQYDLAVDRLNPRVEPLFRPSHPSVLRLLEGTIEAARTAGIPVTMCGEMGGHSIYTVLLLGLGLREFSLTPGYVPRVRRLLRSLTMLEARRIASECMRLDSARRIEALLRARVAEVGAG